METWGRVSTGSLPQGAYHAQTLLNGNNEKSSHTNVHLKHATHTQ